MRTMGRAFLATGAGLGVMFVVYWVTSYEAAGTVLLAGGSVLALVAGAYMTWAAPRAATERAVAQQREPGPRLPVEVGGHLGHRSVWPLVMALGAALVGLGVLVGWWVAVVGGEVLAVCLVGVVAGYRHRTSRHPQVRSAAPATSGQGASHDS